MAMVTEAVEDYLKAIYTLSKESPTGEAGMSRVAAVVGVTTGTATAMAKKLAVAKLARYQRFGGVSLTAKGTRAAVDIIRRHRLIETFLVQTLKLDWSVVHEEAERVEHAVSPRVLEALDAFLGRPEVDPHGDPIPDADGRFRETRALPLRDLQAGASVRIVRIVDQDERFLLFAAEHGLRPGAQLMVLAADAVAQSITVQADGAPVTLALAAAEKILVGAR
ncbi:MAG: metal-dependent transcriptional regulator [Candidatus Latescibacteria bacterium]|nr:metal-dependent transcriptional regulator [bacterium]MCB9515762.1 metal-dependent transcriptional regulator [Candidatus Latescibacterota bacterium]